MDDRVLPGVLVIAFLVLLLVLMYLGWRRRQRSQSGLPRPLPEPDEPGDLLISLDALYVASTFADRPLDRIAVGGLGYRARATVSVFESGVVLALQGEEHSFVPANRITGVDRATWTIDRAVEPGGLVRLTWRLGDTDVDSYLRLTEPPDPTGLISAIESITRASAAPDDTN